MNLEGVVWADIETASMRTRAHGTKIWDLWKGENGAKAMIVKIEAGGNKPNIKPKQAKAFSAVKGLEMSSASNFSILERNVSSWCA